jgi:hypothetical protein
MCVRDLVRIFVYENCVETIDKLKVTSEKSTEALLITSHYVIMKSNRSTVGITH